MHIWDLGAHGWLTVRSRKVCLVPVSPAIDVSPIGSPEPAVSQTSHTWSRSVSPMKVPRPLRTESSGIRPPLSGFGCTPTRPPTSVPATRCPARPLHALPHVTRASPDTRAQAPPPLARGVSASPRQQPHAGARSSPGTARPW
eukprot:280839-Rhodomonas_salina.1